MHLVIISHTEHYLSPDGTVVGWGPTVMEINHLMKVFDTITHMAMLHPGTPPPSALPYESKAIKFVPLPVVGGSRMQDKFKILLKAPTILSKVNKALKTADVFQFRAPTGIGVYLIPYLNWAQKQPGWFKYAGNWAQKQPPLGYRWQRWLLKHQSKPVTLNGIWPNQPSHCLSFENPCLTQEDVRQGEHVIRHKNFKGRLNLCFVGRLETPKGVGRLLLALKLLDPKTKERLGEIHLVGDGPERASFEAMARETGVKVFFHGFLPRTDVLSIYKQCHAIVMPTTASEGFPKALAEAMNYGCVPLVSKVSAIGHYLQDRVHGYVLTNPSAQAVSARLKDLAGMDENEYLQLLKNQRKVVSKFTFDHYNEAIVNQVLTKLNRR